MDLAFDSQDRLYVVGIFLPRGNRSAPIQHRFTLEWKHLGRNRIGLRLFCAGSLLLIHKTGWWWEDELIRLGRVHALHIARWDGQAWEALCTTTHIDPPNVLLVHDDIIYSGGANIWKIQNGACQILGGGISILPLGDKPAVLALALDQKGRLVIGGQFGKVGQVQVNNIARWNGLNWETLRQWIWGWRGFLHPGRSSDRLIVGGVFSQAGGKVSRNLAIWQEPFYAWLPILDH